MILRYLENASLNFYDLQRMTKTARVDNRRMVRGDEKKSHIHTEDVCRRFSEGKENSPRFMNVAFSTRINYSATISHIRFDQSPH